MAPQASKEKKVPEFDCCCSAIQIELDEEEGKENDRRAGQPDGRTNTSPYMNAS
jgi:hypothetical protein